MAWTSEHFIHFLKLLLHTREWYSAGDFCISVSTVLLPEMAASHSHEIFFPLQEVKTVQQHQEKESRFSSGWDLVEGWRGKTSHGCNVRSPVLLMHTTVLLVLYLQIQMLRSALVWVSRRYVSEGVAVILLFRNRNSGRNQFIAARPYRSEGVLEQVHVFYICTEANQSECEVHKRIFVKQP